MLPPVIIMMLNHSGGEYSIQYNPILQQNKICINLIFLISISLLDSHCGFYL